MILLVQKPNRTSSLKSMVQLQSVDSYSSTILQHRCKVDEGPQLINNILNVIEHWL